MSAKLTDLVWSHYPNGGGELLTALALADHGDPDGTHIYPGLDTLSEMTRQSKRAIQNHVGNMLSINWLVVVKQGGGRGKLTEYRIPIECIPQEILGTWQKLPRINLAQTWQKHGKSARDSIGTRTNIVKTAATRARKVLSTTPKIAAAVSKFHFPEKLSSPDRESALRLLNGASHESKQLLLDELAGRMQDEKKDPLKNPLGFLKTLVDAEHVGGLATNYAPTIQVQREHAQVQREVAAARAANGDT